MSKQNAMQMLTAHIRALVAQRHFSEAEDEAAQAMSAAPHAAQPHNLMGIIAESRNDHVQAMKHFRAAWALDPTYRPARINMEADAPTRVRRDGVHAMLCGKPSGLSD